MKNTMNDMIDEWERRMKALKEAEEDVRRCDTSLKNATNNLGKRITPGDAEPGECFNVWYKGKLLSVEKVDHTKSRHLMEDYTIRWRE